MPILVAHCSKESDAITLEVIKSELLVIHGFTAAKQF